jgi:hypothetical protein
MPPPPFRAERVCSAGLDAVLVLAKRKRRGDSRKSEEKRRALYAGLETRRRAFTPEIPKLPPPARALAVDFGVAIARDCMFVARGLKGLPPEVIEQRLAQVPDQDFREAVLALMASG